MDRAEFPQGNPQTIHKECGNRIEANLVRILVGIGNGDRGPVLGIEK
jgi:hypothetical protein